MSDETAYQPRIKITWLIGTLAVFAIFVVIGAYSKRMARDYTDYDHERAQERVATLDKVRKAENALLYPAVDDKGNPTAKWIDQAKGIAAIPIDEAMAKEIDTLKAQPATICAEIPVPPPPAPAAGGTNAAPVAPSAPAAKGTSASTNAAPVKPAAPAAGPAPAPAKPKKSNK